MRILALLIALNAYSYDCNPYLMTEKSIKHVFKVEHIHIPYNTTKLMSYRDKIIKNACDIKATAYAYTEIPEEKEIILRVLYGKAEE